MDKIYELVIGVSGRNKALLVLLSQNTLSINQGKFLPISFLFMELGQFIGATTLRITTLLITTFSITTLSITSFRTTTLSIKKLNVIMDKT